MSSDYLIFEIRFYHVFARIVPLIMSLTRIYFLPVPLIVSSQSTLKDTEALMRALEYRIQQRRRYDAETLRTNASSSSSSSSLKSGGVAEDADKRISGKKRPHSSPLSHPNPDKLSHKVGSPPSSSSVVEGEEEDWDAEEVTSTSLSTTTKTTRPLKGGDVEAGNCEMLNTEEQQQEPARSQRRPNGSASREGDVHEDSSSNDASPVASGGGGGGRSSAGSSAWKSPTKDSASASEANAGALSVSSSSSSSSGTGVPAKKRRADLPTTSTTTKRSLEVAAGGSFAVAGGSADTHLPSHSRLSPCSSSVDGGGRNR